MDFAAMKRRELQALCKRHGLAAGGTNADLVARLTATLSGSGGAAEEAVGVVVGKGCLKRSAGGASGGDLDAAKKVTFELEEDEEAEAGVTGRGRRRSQVLSSPAVAKTRGRPKAGEAPAGAKGIGGERRRTRSQAGGDSADESDSGEASADAPVRPSVTRKNSAKAEQEEVDVGRKYQLKRKTRENDIEDVDVSGQVGISRRSTRSSSLLLEPDALSSPVEKKRGRRKAADVKEKTRVEEQPTEALNSGRTLRSGVVLVAPVPPIVSESKNSRLKVQEEEPAVEKVAKVEISGRTTRSSSVAAAVTSPRVTAKKRGRKTDDVHSDGGPDKKMEINRQSSRHTTRSSIHHLASSGEEASLEQDAAPTAAIPPRRSRRNPSVSVGGEIPFSVSSGKASATDMQIKVPGPVRRSTRKSVVPSSLEHETNDMREDVEKKQTVTKPVGKSTRRSVAPVILEKESKGLTKEMVSSGKASAADMQIGVPGPVRRSTRKSAAPSSLEHETSDVHEDVEKKQTVTKPVGRSTRRSVAPVILEKESKGLTREMVPEAHVKRPTRKSVVPAMLEKGRKSIVTEVIPEARVKRSTRKLALPVNSENNDHGEVVGTENLQSDNSEELEKQPTVKQPVKWLTRKSAVPAMLEKDRKGVPDMLNNENGDCTEMQSYQVGHLKKQRVVKEHVGRSTGKSVVPDVIEKENKGLHEELKSEVSVRTPVCKSVVPNAVNKENKDHNEFVRREELSVKTRSTPKSLQVALQNDESLGRTTRQSSKLVLSPPQTKLTASKGRPAKRRRTASLQESMPAEEQKEDHPNYVIEVATSTDLEIGGLPFTLEKSDLWDSQLNSELESMVVVEPVLSHDKEDSDVLEFELEGTLGTTEKPPSSLPIPDCEHVGSLSEEAVHSNENDAGRCSPNFEQSPIGLQFLFSKGIAERSAKHNAIPCPENSVEESDVHKVECRVETVVSSKSDSDQGFDESSVRVEKSGGCTFSSQPNNEQEGFSVSSCPKDLVISAQLDLSEDADHVLRDVITKDLICKEEEKDLIPSSDVIVPHEISPANEPEVGNIIVLPRLIRAPPNAAENASGVSGAVFCISQSTPISDEVNSDSSRLESPDALDNRIASSNTEEVQQDNKEECNLHNGVTHGIDASGMSEAAQVEVSKGGKMLLPDVETSAFRDAQLNCKREGNEFEEHSFSRGKDESGKNNMSQLANKYVMDSRQEQELKLPHDLSAVKSPKGSTTCQDEFLIGSGIGRTSGSIVKGNNIAMDAPGTAKQGDNLSPSATTLLRIRENTPACKIDAPELSSDHLFAMDLSARAVQSIGGRLREAALAVCNPDNKLRMEQVQQDDVQVLEGNLENTALGSATPESDQQCGVSEEAEPESLKNERCSSTVEQSPFGLQSLFLQNDLQVQHGTLEQTAIVSATPVCKHEYGLPDKAESHSLKNVICSSSVEPSPFRLQSLFSSDDVHVEEGTLEKATLGSATPECGLPDEAGPLTFKKIFSSSVEQSPFGLQSLFSQDDVHVQDGTLEKAALGSATPECKHERGLPDEAEPHSLKEEICSSSVEQSPFGLQSLFSQDDAHVQEGTLEKAARDSVTPECKHGCGLPDEAEPHSSKNERCSTSVDQSPFGLQLLFSQESIEEPSENVALAVHAKNGVDESKDIHVEYRVEKAPVPESVSDHDSSVDFNAVSKSEDCAYTCDQGNEYEGLTKSCHEPEQMACQVDLLEAANCMKDFTCPEEVSCDEENKKPVHSTDISSSCENIDANGPVKHASGLGDGLLSSSLIASTDDTDVHPSSNSYQFESTDFLDEPKGCSSTEALQQGLKEQCDEPKENQVTYGAFPSDMIEADTAKDLESEVPPLQAEETSNMLEYLLLQESSKGFDMPGDFVLPSAENEDDSNTCHVKLQVEKMVSSDTDSSKGSDMHGDLVLPCAENEDDSNTCHVELQGEKMDSSEPDSSKGSDMHGDLVLPSAETEDDSIVCHVELKLEKMVSSEHDSHQGSREDLTIVEGFRGRMFSSQLEHEKDEQLIAPLLAAETSALPDEQANPELEQGEFEKCNFSSLDTSGKIGTGDVKLHRDSHMYPIQGKELPDDLPAPKSPEQSTIGRDAETSALLDAQPNPELEGGEVEERNYNLFQLHEDSCMDPIWEKELPNYLHAPKSPKQSNICRDDNVLGSETSLFPDEKFYPELECEEFKGHNNSCDKAASDTFSSGSVKNNTCHWDNEEEYNEHNDDRATAAMLSSGMTKPTLIEGSESGMGLLSAAGTPALTDEQLNSKLEDDKQQNLCFDTDTSNISDTGLMENNNLFSLPEDTLTETCYEHELPIGTPAAKSAGESAVCPDGSVSGSVGICQTSGRRRVDEISKKLLRFKISSTVKGSYIAMDSANTKQGDNPSLISFLGNTENVPAANPDHPAEPNAELSAAKDSSRQGTTDGLE